MRGILRLFAALGLVGGVLGAIGSLLGGWTPVRDPSGLWPALTAIAWLLSGLFWYALCGTLANLDERSAESTALLRSLQARVRDLEDAA